MTAAATDAQLLTINEAAGRLRCSRAHVYRLIAARVLPVTDIAGPGARKPKTRVRADGLRRYIDGGTRRAPA